MKRNKRKSRPARQAPATPAAKPETKAAPAASRRRFLKTARNSDIAALVASAGGGYFIAEARAKIREHGLERIGNGVPAIVRIHDPQCPRYVALQREARDAVCGFDDDELQFLVANIKNPSGRKLASRHGVAHVTLLLFDGEGKRRSILTGPQQSEGLTHAFRRHVDRYRGS